MACYTGAFCRMQVKGQC